ncbi:MAG: hypothetical protein WCS99_00830, partial [Limisphaerales bacterium]
VGKVRQVDELVAGIATASSEQSQGIGQVNTAVTQMDKVTQSNAASAEESASAAEELNGQTNSLKEAVNELQRLMGSDAQSARPATRAGVEVMPGPARHNGGARPATKSPARPAATKRSNAPALVNAGSRESLPMPGDSDFKDF